MATTDLGKWMITNGGDYDPDVTYEKLTMVMYDNSTYITLKTVTGVTPSNDQINYALMARGFDPGVLSSVTAVDTSGALGNAGETVSAQSLVDYLADAVMTKLVEKANISNVQVNDSSKVPSAALAYAMQQQITENEDAITGLNNNLGYNYSYDGVKTFNEVYSNMSLQSTILFEIAGGSTIANELNYPNHSDFGAIIFAWKVRTWRGGAIAIPGAGWANTPIYIGMISGEANNFKWLPLVTNTDNNLKDRSNIWSGSLELSSENQTINIASAENYNQILVIIKNAASNITAAIMIDRYLYNSETNIYYRVSDSSYHANIDIVPILDSFKVRLEGEHTGTWTLVAVIGKI